MWYNDVSCLDTLDMDMRACPSYKAGFDACDPLASVLDWSNRGPARVLRRRCRSEGVDRSPYEDSPLPRSGDGKINSHAPRLPNRSEFTINSVDDHLDRINQYHYPRVEKHGDYITMPPERSWSPPVGSKLHNHVLSPNRARPLLIPNNIEEKYLPKVEELFEKNDHEMMEVSVKQPLKSILNNPLPKTPPQGILKKPKPKIHSDSKSAQEGRRRQRAISESDNFFCGININSALAYDSRLGSYVKRVKDNSGAGYSYGTGLAHSKPAVKSSGASPKTVKHITQKEIHGSTSPVRRSITPIQHSTPTRHEMPQHEASAMPRHDMPRHEVPVMHVLRTTAINNVVESTRVTPTQPAATPRKSSRSPEPRARSKRSGSPDSKESKASPVNPTSPVKKTPKTPKKTIKSPKSPRKTKNKVVANGDVLKLEVSPINTAKNMININTNQIKMETAAVVQDVLNPVLIEESTPKVALPFKIMTESTPAPANRNHTEGSVKATPASKSLRSPSPAVPADLPTPPVPTSPTRQPAIPGKPAKHSDEELIDQAVVKLSNRLNGTAVSPAKLNTVMKVFTEKAKETTRPMLSSLVTINPFKPVPIRKAESALVLPESVKTCLRVSLFPRVPPYLKFIGHDETMPIKVHPAIQKHLKWKLTSITPIVVRKTLMNSGFRLVRSECETSECPHEETVDWIGIWGKHMKSTMFRAIKDGQKMNHFPGTFQIGRKDRLWRNLQKLVTKFGSNEFGIMPKSYVLPHDMKLLKRDWEKYAEENERWIIKPPASARGTGIKVVSRWTQIPKKKAVVVQKYVSKPLLINGNKFDMRLYVLVTSVHPLRIYLYKDGLARFASVKYNDEIESLNDRYMHLTNYSINRLSKNYTPNEDFAACEGHKWTLQTLFSYLESEKKVNIKHLWETLKDLVIKTIIAGEGSISALTKANITSRYNCYELFGIDVLLDEEMKPWLLEVNISPSLHSASPLDLHVKGPLVTTTLNIAQFQVPVKTNLDTIVKEKPHKLNGLPYDGRLYTVYLSKEERDKHIIYTNMADRSIYLRDIISTLTPDDVRHLIQAEDELTQAVDMERVFPTEDTHKYLNFLTGPRYYNRLFDAWETRYAKNRLPGIELLRDLCDIGYHLEVPPVPLKISKNTLWPYLDNIDPLTGTQGENDVDAPSPPVSEQCSSSSVASVEPTASTASIHVARGICGDSIPPRVLPSPLEPCA